jgi:hypothetical protein
MDTDLVQRLGPRPAVEPGTSRTDLVTCSLCLRVLRDGEWMPAERVIREIRSYDLESPPRLRSTVCDGCADSILSRRAQARNLSAA